MRGVCHRSALHNGSQIPLALTPADGLRDRVVTADQLPSVLWRSGRMRLGASFAAARHQVYAPVDVDSTDFTEGPFRQRKKMQRFDDFEEVRCPHVPSTRCRDGVAGRRRRTTWICGR